MLARYLGNTNTKEVHDSWNEQRNCRIPEIELEHRTRFESLEEAHAARYADCPWCIKLKPE